MRRKKYPEGGISVGRLFYISVSCTRNHVMVTTAYLRSWNGVRAGTPLKENKIIPHSRRSYWTFPKGTLSAGGQSPTGLAVDDDLDYPHRNGERNRDI